MEIERKPKKINKNTGVITNFKVTHRNDPCPCNSGLKFKKCCLNELGPQIMLERERLKNQK